MSSSPSLLTPTTTTITRTLIPPPAKTPTSTPTQTPTSTPTPLRLRREVTLAAAGLLLLLPIPARAASDEEYVQETNKVIGKVRSTINLDRSDPSVAEAVADLRELSNTWVSKYRREKSLLGRPSFRDVYSALNAVSGHYVSFGPTTPIPSKRKARILEEVDTAEKALLRGR